MLMERPGAERLKMGCSMHATAQVLAKAYILRRYPGSHPAKLKRLLFLQFYRADFEPEKLRRIASTLFQHSRHSKALEIRKRTTRKPSDLRDLSIVKSSGSATVREKGEKYGKTRRAKVKRRRPIPAELELQSVVEP